MGFSEQRFTATVDEEFKCPICRDIVEEPITSQCEHVFCKTCIDEWLSKDCSCPVDRKPLKAHHLSDVSRFYRNFYLKLEIKCEFESIGCHFVCKVDEIKGHQNKCEFSPNIKGECSKGCKAMITKSEVSTHNCVEYLMKVINERNKQISEMTEREAEYKRKLLDFQITIKTKNSEINHLNECLFEKQNQSSENKSSIVPLIGHSLQSNSHQSSDTKYMRNTEINEINCFILSFHKFKLLLVGDKGVGKSSILLRFINNDFVDSDKSSVNGYRSRTIELDDRIIDLEIWENSRQFNVFTDFREVDGIMFVYDVTKWKTFHHLNKYIKDMKPKTKNGVKRLLIGNKCDVIESKTVDYLSALKFSRFCGIPFIETSAKSGCDVEEAFYRIITQSVIQLSDLRPIN